MNAERMLLKAIATAAAIAVIYQATNGIGEGMQKQAADRAAEKLRLKEEREEQYKIDQKKNEASQAIDKPIETPELTRPNKLQSQKTTQQQLSEQIRQTEKWESRECRFWWDHDPTNPAVIRKAKTMQSCQGGF